MIGPETKATEINTAESKAQQYSNVSEDKIQLERQSRIADFLFILGRFRSAYRAAFLLLSPIILLCIGIWWYFFKGDNNVQPEVVVEAPSFAQQTADQTYNSEPIQSTTEQSQATVELSADNIAAGTNASSKKPVCEFKEQFGPEMLVIPGGVFLMGVVEGNKLNGNLGESPRKLTIQAFAMGRCEISVAEFRLFTESTQYVTQAEEGDGCLLAGESRASVSNHWRNPGFNQQSSEPVVCVSRRDVNAYLDWLNKRLSGEYRLPSEAEWEYVALDAAQNFDPLVADTSCLYANLSSSKNCSDDYVYTAPLGSFQANAYGLMDIFGNVSELVDACWQRAEAGDHRQMSRWGGEGSGNCEQSAVRGGAWNSSLDEASPTAVSSCSHVAGCSYLGFRVAKSLISLAEPATAN